MQKIWGRLLLIVVLGLVVLGVWLSRPSGPEIAGTTDQDSQAAAVAVELADVRQGEIRDIRRFTGTLYPAAQFEVAPRVSGKLEQLYVDLGDEVVKGQPIARLDDAEYQQEVEEARAAVAVARATLAEARSSLDAKEKEFQRTQQLREQKIASESELDTVKAESVAQKARVTLAEAQVSQAQAALRAAEVRLSYARIHANWQNDDQVRVVGERFVDEGTTISANTPIVSVLDISELTGAIHVTENDYPHLEISQSVRIVADAYPGREFTGSIVRIAPLFREASRQARVEIRIENRNRLLKPGMFVSAHVELTSRQNATIIPFDSLVERDEHKGVFTVDRNEGRARFVRVDTGIVQDDKVEIVDPQLTGEVVTLGQHLLDDGSAIVIPGS